MCYLGYEEVTGVTGGTERSHVLPGGTDRSHPHMLYLIAHKGHRQGRGNHFEVEVEVEDYTNDSRVPRQPLPKTSDSAQYFWGETQVILQKQNTNKNERH